MVLTFGSPKISQLPATKFFSFWEKTTLWNFVHAILLEMGKKCVHSASRFCDVCCFQIHKKQLVSFVAGVFFYKNTQNQHAG